MIKMLPLVDALRNTSHMAERRKQIEASLNEEPKDPTRMWRVDNVKEELSQNLRDATDNLNKLETFARRDLEDPKLDKIIRSFQLKFADIRLQANRFLKLVK